MRALIQVAYGLGFATGFNDFGKSQSMRISKDSCAPVSQRLGMRKPARYDPRSSVHPVKRVILGRLRHRKNPDSIGLQQNLWCYGCH
jgi:hypothetical protein